MRRRVWGAAAPQGWRPVWDKRYAKSWAGPSNASSVYDQALQSASGVIEHPVPRGRAGAGQKNLLNFPRNATIRSFPRISCGRGREAARIAKSSRSTVNHC